MAVKTQNCDPNGLWNTQSGCKPLIAILRDLRLRNGLSICLALVQTCLTIHTIIFSSPFFQEKNSEAASQWAL